MILIIDTMGVAKNIPTMPHTNPKNMSANSNVTGLTSNDFPIIRVSITFPLTNWIVEIKMKQIIAEVGDIAELSTKNGTGRIELISGPIFGMKFKRNARKPKTTAKGTPNNHNTNPNANPVTSEITVFINRYLRI